MLYYFSDKRVCKYLQNDPQNVPEYPIQDKHLFIDNTSGFSKDHAHNLIKYMKNTNLKSIGSGANSKVYQMGTTDWLLKFMHPVEESDFWDEVLLQLKCSFENISPKIAVAEYYPASKTGHIVMKMVFPTKSTLMMTEWTDAQLQNIWKILNKLKIVHFDFRPENILVTKEKLFLIDFGMAVQFRKNDKIYTRFASKKSLKDLYDSPNKPIYLPYWDFAFFTGYTFLVQNRIYNNMKFVEKQNFDIKMLLDFIYNHKDVYKKFGIYPIYDEQLTSKKIILALINN